MAVPQRRNPQPCGFFNDPSRECHCTPLQIQRYVSKISGPLLDRIDIHIDMPAVKYRDLREAPDAEGSDVIRERVIRTRRLQLERYQGEKIYSNAQMSPRQLRKYCNLSPECERLLENAMSRLGPERARPRPNPQGVPHHRRHGRLRGYRSNSHL